MTLLTILRVFYALATFYTLGVLVSFGVQARQWIILRDPEPPEWYIALSIAWPLVLPYSVIARLIGIEP